MSAFIPDLVSVVIPVRDRARWLPAAVQSALDQRHAGVEVLLCDDGSTDGTERTVDTLASRDPDRIRVLHLPGAVRQIEPLAEPRQGPEELLLQDDRIPITLLR